MLSIVQWHFKSSFFRLCNRPSLLVYSDALARREGGLSRSAERWMRDNGLELSIDDFYLE